jgi:glycosyltransferase involved in cell wall biosynthesis
MKISIIIPVYNQSQYIRECLESALRQTEKALEIIVVNDGSTDNLQEHLKPFLRKINLINLEKNKGVAYARNTGIANSKGDLIIFQDGDDISTETRNALTVQAFENSENQYAKCNVFNFANTGSRIHPRLQSNLNKTIVAPEGACCLAVRSAFFKEIGTFKTELDILEDFDWELRAKLRGFYPININHTLVHRRVHASNITGIDAKKAIALKNKVILKNLAERVARKK